MVDVRPVLAGRDAEASNVIAGGNVPGSAVKIVPTLKGSHR
jgi:hypothetical protein